MKTDNIFALSELTDADLRTLMSNISEERERRERKRKEHKCKKERQKWINRYFYSFLCHPNATYIQIDETIVAAFYERNTGMHIGTAKPIKGDAFDIEVGIAVAYAKALGDKIPNYI